MQYRIAFCGRSCSGKTSYARYLAELRPHDSLRMSFGAPVKAQYAAANGLTIADLDRDKAKYRSALQEYGHSNRGDGRWIRALSSLLELAKAPDFRLLVVDDMRYLDEAAFLRDNGFTLIRLSVSDKELRRRYKLKYGVRMTREQWDHPSETESSLIEVDEEWNGMGKMREQLREWLWQRSMRALAEIVGT